MGSGVSASRSKVKTIQIKGELPRQTFLESNDDVDNGRDASINELGSLNSDAPDQLFGCVVNNERETQNDGVGRRDLETQTLRRKLEEAEKRAQRAESELLLHKSVAVGGVLAADVKHVNINHRDNQTVAKIHAQIVEKLESELRTAAEEMIAMRSRYDKKIRRLRSNSAKTKAESQVTIIELSEENSRLVEENASLLAQIDNCNRRLHQTSTSYALPRTSDIEEETMTDSRTKLIIELSHQVSQLDEELQQAKATITKLKSNHSHRISSATSRKSSKKLGERTSNDTSTLSRDSLLDET
ncbi:coiled-coil domain-containing protein 192-like [Corticium candelabrum]|uniref:coiled-coil domain-containing protein 192-like n=1 Tax=Corticium candelabrum TaxID=121492 RepID=UPI002E26FA38|nr:coiled-coil domain-containing protein 192-like [Corticium candelabrum]